MIRRVDVVTFDDFQTLRYSVGVEEDIVFPIVRSLKWQGVRVDEEEFLQQYFELDRQYRVKLKETLRDSSLDRIVLDALAACGLDREEMRGIVLRAVEWGLGTRRVRWFPDAKRILVVLRRRGLKLGVVSNTHWGWLGRIRHEFERLFDVVTLSCEHGFAKPHPSIFLTTLEELGVEPARCVHVGDDPVADVEGAKGVGMRTIFVKRTDITANANFTIQQLSELEQLL